MPSKGSKSASADDLHNLRHSLAHVLAQAVLNIWPDTKTAIGPPIETGCYYDFLFKKPISEEDFKALEKEMRKIINQGQTFESDTLSIKDATKFWQDQGQQFKVELIEDLAKEGEKEVTNYRNIDKDGKETFVDLCRGGHVESLKDIPADGFKVMSLAGAYWRGDEKREQLTRIYVAAFPSKDELKHHLEMLEEAKKRDHRVLGQQLDLFAFSDRVGSGLPMMLPKGEVIKHALETYIREEKAKLGYSFVNIPHIAKRELYEKSGHMGKYDAMMPPMKDEEGNEFVIKPMNCPHHFELFNSRPHSYREMPLRYAENTTCYRNEKTGELAGLTRVKNLMMDDTHHFVRHEQIESEIKMILGLMKNIYATFGLEDFKVAISVRDPEHPEKYFGDNEVWNQAEDKLVKAVEDWGVDYVKEEGEAAFYGPKIDIQVKDVIGRNWQLTTVQLDFVQPENFDMNYVNEAGDAERPAVLHVAILGSSHRFMGVLIEHFAGLFPLWLAPTQVALLPVAKAHEKYAQELQAQLTEAGIRTEYMDSEESLGKRIRTGEQAKIPYLLVMGDDEVKGKSATVRNVKTKEQVSVKTDKLIKMLTDDVTGRKLEYSIG